MATLEAAFNTATRRGMLKYARHASCESCVGAGGAWCLTSPPRCVPDLREMCGPEVAPTAHVGHVGYGRCPGGAETTEIELYHHAPRRPPQLEKPPGGSAEAWRLPCGER